MQCNLYHSRQQQQLSQNWNISKWTYGIIHSIKGYKGKIKLALWKIKYPNVQTVSVTKEENTLKSKLLNMCTISKMVKLHVQVSSLRALNFTVLLTQYGENVEYPSSRVDEKREDTFEILQLRLCWYYKALLTPHKHLPDGYNGWSQPNTSDLNRGSLGYEIKASSGRLILG